MSAKKELNYKVNVRTRGGEYLPSQLFATPEKAVSFAISQHRAGYIPDFQVFEPEVGKWMEDGDAEKAFLDKLPKPKKAIANDSFLVHCLSTLEGVAKEYRLIARTSVLDAKQRSDFLLSVGTLLEDMRFTDREIASMIDEVYYGNYYGERNFEPPMPEVVATSEQLPVETLPETQPEPMEPFEQAHNAEFAVASQEIEPGLAIETPTNKKRGKLAFFGG